ncbi:MAG: serine hydrolase [Candidatus Hydrogenedentota bacterium]|nr:MAG: serine hydrolase [Candidatus Hydrogenedentota bacterium]
MRLHKNVFLILLSAALFFASPYSSFDHSSKNLVFSKAHALTRTLPSNLEARISLSSTSSSPSPYLVRSEAIPLFQSSLDSLLPSFRFRPFAVTARPRMRIFPLPFEKAAPPVIPPSYRSILTRLLADSPAKVSVVVCDPRNGWRFEYGSDEIVRAASVIKLPILVALFRMAERGEITLQTRYHLREKDRTGGSGRLRFLPFRHRTFSLRELAERMIRDSDNTATNAIIRIVGNKKLNREFVRMGFKSTRLRHRILASPKDNPTTAEEISRLLLELENPTSGRNLLYSDTSRRELLAILETCSNRERLARYLPESLPVPHKTGTLRDVVHDAGILPTRGGPLVVVALTTQVPRRRDAARWIARLGGTLYSLGALQTLR